MIRNGYFFVGAMLMLVGISLCCEQFHGTQFVRGLCVAAEGGLIGYRIAVTNA